MHGSSLAMVKVWEVEFNRFERGITHIRGALHIGNPVARRAKERDREASPVEAQEHREGFAAVRERWCAIEREAMSAVDVPR